MYHYRDHVKSDNDFRVFLTDWPSGSVLSPENEWKILQKSKDGELDWEWPCRLPLGVHVTHWEVFQGKCGRFWYYSHPLVLTSVHAKWRKKIYFKNIFCSSKQDFTLFIMRIGNTRLWLMCLNTDFLFYTSIAILNTLFIASAFLFK